MLAQYKAGTIDFTRVTQLEQTLVQQQDVLTQAQRRNRRGTDPGLQGPGRRLANPLKRLRTHRGITLRQAVPRHRTITHRDPRTTKHSTSAAEVSTHFCDESTIGRR